MTAHYRSIAEFSNATNECRDKPRIDDSFPARVWGVDVNGRKFETEVTLDNLSASGLLVSLTNRVELSTDICVLIRFLDRWSPDDAPNEETYARVVVWGNVVRSELKWDGANETAVAFLGHIVL